MPIPAKFKNYDIYNADGTVRYTRHVDGSVLLPTFIFLDTGEEVSINFYTVVGVPLPTRPTTPTPSDHFDDQSQPSMYDSLQVSEDGFVRLGDRVTLKDGTLNLVDRLEAAKGAQVNSTRADSTVWPFKVYLPTGQEISDPLIAWLGGAAAPRPDTWSPSQTLIIGAEQDFNSTNVDLAWDHAEDTGQGITSYRIYVDNVQVAIVPGADNSGTFNLGTYGEKLVEVAAVDAAGNIGPRGAVQIALVQPDAAPTTTGATLSGTSFYRTHAGNAPAAGAPTQPPANPKTDDAVIERWDDLVRVWMTPNGTVWTKPIEFPIGGGAVDPEFILSNVPLVGLAPTGAAAGYDRTAGQSYIVDAGGNWEAVSDSQVEKTITDGDIATAGTPLTTEVQGLATAGGWRNSIVEYVGAGTDGEPDYVWSIDNAGEATLVNAPSSLANEIVNDFNQQFTNPSTWSGVAGKTNHVIDFSAIGRSEIFGIIDPDGTPHPFPMAHVTTITNGATGIGTDPEDPFASELRFFMSLNSINVPLAGDLLEYTTPTGKVLIYDVVMEDDYSSRYMLRPQLAAGASEDMFERVTTKANRTAAPTTDGFLSLVGTNQVLYRWDLVGTTYEIADMDRSGPSSDQALLSEHEPNQKWHNTDINRMFSWTPGAPLGADWVEIL